jgi:ubiquitin carboxyl-terminal hydrolase 9/24
MPPKCKNNTTRERCLELLNELCTKNTEGIQILIRYLKNHISETFWRTPRKSDWTISVHQQERSLTGFVGLKNIGCICYMNSIMQQLFMIPTFRKAILEVEDVNYGKESDEENVL